MQPENKIPTAASLLQETANFTRRVFDDLARAKIVTEKLCGVPYRQITLFCVDPKTMPLDVRDSLKRRVTLVEAGPYPVTHSAVIQGFLHTFNKILADADLNNTDGTKEPDDFTETDYAYGIGHGKNSIVSLSLFTGAEAEDIRDILAHASASKHLATYCMEGLKTALLNIDLHEKERTFQEAMIDALERNPNLNLMPAEAVTPAGIVPKRIH